MMSLLSVTVKKARYVGIQAQQFNTYVTLKLQNVKSTTVTVKGATPCWEQDFLFETNNLDTGLLIEVWSKGMIWDRAIGYQWIPLQTIQYSNEEGTGQWRALEAELLMQDGEVIGTKMPTGHSLLVDCRFELPFDAENIEAMDLQRKLEMLNNSMDQEGRVDNFRRQMIYLGHSHDNHFENDISAGYSEDSDYTSDLNYPVGQHPNSSASQFRSAAYQINTPQRSLETSRENSSERADTPNAYNQQMLGVMQNHHQHLSPDVHRRHHQLTSTTDNFNNYRTNVRGQSNQIQENNADGEPLFYNSRPHNRKLNKSNYSSHESWMSCESTVYNQSADSFDASFYVDATDVPNQFNKARRPSLERQTTLYDDVNYDYPAFTSNNVSRYPFPQNKSVDEYFDSMPFTIQDERFGQEDEDRQWDSGGFDPYASPRPRTSKKLPTLPAALQNITNKQPPTLQNSDYSPFEEPLRPMSTGRRRMPQIPTKKLPWRQFSQQSQDDGCKTPESYSHRGASLPPTPTKNSRIVTRLAQALEPTRAMTPGRKLPTPITNNRGKRNKLIKRTSSADYADSQFDTSYMRFGAVSAAENYNEDYNYAYQSTDNLPVAQDVDVYSVPSVINDKNVGHPQTSSRNFQNDYYNRTAQNCDYNQTYYNDDAYRKKGMDADLIQQNTDSLEPQSEGLFKSAFDSAVSSITNSLHQFTKSSHAEPTLDTFMTNPTSALNHNLDNIAQKNILNTLPHLGDQHHNLNLIDKDEIYSRTTGIDNSGLPSLTVAQVHNQNLNNGSNNRGYLTTQNCIDSGYYGNQLDNNRDIQEEPCLDVQDSVDDYIEDETEDSISYGQNQAIKHDAPMSVIHLDSRDDGASVDQPMMRSREPSQASVILDPYHTASAAALQRAQQQAEVTISRRPSAADSLHQTYGDQFLNYQRKNSAEINSRRGSVRPSPTDIEHFEDILEDEQLQGGLHESIDEGHEETVLDLPEIHEEEPVPVPKITAQQRWLWAYDKIIMQLDVVGNTVKRESHRLSARNSTNLRIKTKTNIILFLVLVAISF